MKKIYSILSIVALMCLFMACSDDERTYESPAKIIIKSADLVFSPIGGTNFIETDTKEVLEATTTSKWLTVSVEGSSVKLIAEPNEDLQTRTAIINLSTGNAKTSVTAQQRGMILDLDMKDLYAFEYAANEPVTIKNQGNIDFVSETSADWIHVDQKDDTYTIRVDDNDGTFRKGTVTLKFYSVSKVIKIQQWGKTYPFAEMNTATYTDENGNTHSKAITIVADDSKEGAFLIKGLANEGDIQLLTNSSVPGEFFIPAGYKFGTLTDEGEKTLTLRCVISAKTKTGDRYYPTIINSNGSSPYRMAFKWAADDNEHFTLDYVRNSNLSSTYETDGVIVCKYNSSTGAAAINRKGIVYYFINLKFSKQ